MGRRYSDKDSESADLSPLLRALDAELWPEFEEWVGKNRLGPGESQDTLDPRLINLAKVCEKCMWGGHHG